MARTVLITGGGRGIGRAIAEAFVREGLRVAITSRSRSDAEAAAAALGNSESPVLGVACDVADPSQVAAAVHDVTNRLGPVDILVNNAGIAESAPFARTDDALWNRVLAVNLSGTFYAMRAVVPGMVERGFGRIINIASVAAKVGFAYTAAYCASKHGVLGLTRAVALEVATKGITVNAICPGWVDTDMTATSIARIVEKTGRPAADARRTLEQMSPQRRLITPPEIALVAVMLASDEAHGITGQAINVDGGEVMA